jgi:hypothetical protein
MKKALLLSLALTLGLSTSAFCKDVYVGGYIKQDGTYVPPHHRTSPDGSSSNNYGSAGNINPWTGKVGTETPKVGGSIYDSGSGSIYGKDK